MVLGEKLDYPSNHFDAVLSVGTIGHAPPESFDELIRITKSSGFIVFSLRTTHDDEPQWYRKLQSLEEAGKWRLVEKTDPILGLPGETADVYHYGLVYEVL
jgi:SAM-dependent methyltransferase